MHLPVNILSLTMQFPLTNTASHCIMHPDRGTSMTSPGTKSSEGISINSVQEYKETCQEQPNI